MSTFLKNCLGIVCAAATVASVRADSVSGALLAAPGSGTPINLNTAAGFAYYGAGATPATDNANAAQFSTLTLSHGTINGFANNDSGNIKVTYTNSGGSATNATSFYNVGNNPGQAGNSLSLTSQLFASSETFSIYLSNFDTTSDFIVMLGSTVLYSANQVVLPTSSNGNGTGTGNTYGVLNLTVSGTVGETLTFTDTVDLTGVSATANANIGLNAIAVVAAPEPSPWLLLGIGGICLGLRHRRQSLRN